MNFNKSPVSRRTTFFRATPKKILPVARPPASASPARLVADFGFDEVSDSAAGMDGPAPGDRRRQRLAAG